MRTLVFTAPRRFALEQRPEPLPAPGEVCVAPACVGICGSDTHGYIGTTGRRIPPMVMGHEMSGVVYSVGEGVTSVRPDDRVTVQPILNCGVCSYCAAGRINICPARSFLGVMSTDGALMERLCVPEANIVPLPDSLSDQAAAMIEPFAVAWRATGHALPVEGKTALVIGAGPIGLMLLKALKLRGVACVLVADLSDYRLALAESLGADVVINPRTHPMEQALAPIGGRDAVDATFEAVGITATAAMSIDWVKNGGTVVWVGNSDPHVTVNMQNIVTRELVLKGSYVYDDRDFRECASILGRAGERFDGMVSAVVPLEQAPGMFERLANGEDKLIKVLVKL